MVISLVSGCVSVLVLLLCGVVLRKLRRFDRNLTLLHSIVSDKIGTLEQVQSAWNMQSQLRDEHTHTRLNDIEQSHVGHPQEPN